MQIGKARDLLTFQKKQVSADDYGAQTVVWVDHAVGVWGHLYERMAAEQSTSGAIVQVKLIDINIFWRADITPDMIVLVPASSRKFEIVGITEIAPRKDLRLRVQEVI